MNNRLVIFDLDGTIVDSTAAIVGAMATAMSEHGDPPVPDEAIAALIGLPLVEMFPRLVVRPLTPAEIDARIVSYRASYPDLARHLERPIPGMPELVRDLAQAGVPLAVATSKTEAGAGHALARAGIAQHFGVLIGHDSVAHSKPAPDMIHAALRACPADSAVIIGDTTFDVDMGHNAGVRTIAVTWGNHPRERLTHADVVVDTVLQLRAELGAP